MKQEVKVASDQLGFDELLDPDVYISNLSDDDRFVYCLIMLNNIRMPNENEERLKKDSWDLLERIRVKYQFDSVDEMLAFYRAKMYLHHDIFQKSEEFLKR